jgi:hypothetical protein
MASEFIRLETPQYISSKKNLLYCEMELLETKKHHKNFTELKKQGRSLKKLLKKSITEIREDIRNFETSLPKSKYIKSSEIDILPSEKKRKELDEEIDEIKAKIASLG